MASLVDAADAVPASRRDLQAFGADLPASVAEALREAVEGRRARAFTHLLLAALDAGREVPSDLLEVGAALLPDPDTVASVVGALPASADVGAVLVRAVRSRRIGYEHEPAVLLVAELWTTRRGLARPPGLLGEARIRARRELTHEGEDALVALAGLVGDADLGQLVAPFSQPEVKESARILSARLASRLVDGPLSAMPERPTREARSRAPVRRAVAKVGRNDPCPCGSGKKYKLCHESIDRARLADSSDVEGLTGAELAERLEEHLTETRLQALRSHELARLDPARIEPGLHGPLIVHLAAWGELDRAVDVLAAHWRPELATTAERVAGDAARDGRPDLVRRLAALTGGTERFVSEAQLALVDGAADRLAFVEVLALRDVDSDSLDLGFALLACGLPALGIHVARAELVLRDRDAEADDLLAQLRETRDLLLLPVRDPIDRVLYTMDEGHAPQVDIELAAARGKVEQSDAALKSTQEALDRMRQELARKEAEIRAEKKPSEPLERVVTVVAEDPHVRELREKVEQLKSDLKERHQERNLLRKELDDTRERMAALEAQPSQDGEGSEGDEADEEDEGPPIDVKVASRLRIPVFPDDFAERLQQVPDATARAALLRVGELCAGFDTAFREVRPLRGFDGTWRVKIGRSYRLLFRPENDRLEVLDLLHRQDLEKRLFRLRRGGERPGV